MVNLLVKTVKHQRQVKEKQHEEESEITEHIRISVNLKLSTYNPYEVYTEKTKVVDFTYSHVHTDQ